MEITGVIIFFVGLVLGFIAANFLFRKLSREKANTPNDEQVQLKNEKLILQKDIEHLKGRIEKLIDEFNRQKQRERELLDEKVTLSERLSESKTNLKNVEEKLITQQSELERLQEQFTKEFKLVANAVLRQNSEEFSVTHRKALHEILTPLKEKIKSFEDSVEKKYIDETKERSSLKQEIHQLMELNKTLNHQAENLTTALKGENKTQGNWGEMVLERILESSGLIKGEEYDKQFSDITEDNRRIQPDFVIKLPEERHLIIDSKVSLVAYERFISESDEQARNGHMRELILSIKTHIKQLSEKNYQSGIGLNSPDFVLLFVPIESSFTLAAQYDAELFSFAWDRKVVIVSPTTLLATLRTIASVWKNEKQTKNAQEIATKAGNLYDKFAAFVEDMHKIEKGLNAAQNSYNDAFNKLSSGKGNLLNRVETIRALGVKSKKNLPKEFIETKENETE